MTNSANQPDLESLRLCYDKQTELLKYLTQIDLRIFSGYVVLQLGLGSWITASEKLPGHPAGILILDALVALTAGAFLLLNYLRRKEAAEIVRELNKRLHFDTLSKEIAGARPRSIRPFFYVYVPAIVVFWAAVAYTLIGS